MSAMRDVQRKRSPVRRPAYSYSRRLWVFIVGVSRLCSPAARGVYHPQAHSRVVLGAALPPEADLDLLGRRLWWRGLGLVERDGQLIAGADVSTAAQLRRMQRARTFVTRQLRDAGVRGSVKRWQ